MEAAVIRLEELAHPVPAVWVSFSDSGIFMRYFACSNITVAFSCLLMYLLYYKSLLVCCIPHLELLGTQCSQAAHLYVLWWSGFGGTLKKSRNEDFRLHVICFGGDSTILCATILILTITFANIWDVRRIYSMLHKEVNIVPPLFTRLVVPYLAPPVNASLSRWVLV